MGKRNENFNVGVVSRWKRNVPDGTMKHSYRGVTIKMSMKPKIEYGEYNEKRKLGYKSWVGGKSWVLFVRNDGSLVVFNGRKKSGAVIGNGVVVWKS